MEIFISNIGNVRNMIYENDITHVLSVITFDLVNDIKFPNYFNRNNWLCLEMDDKIDINAHLAPSKSQISKILEWGRSLPEDSHVLVHCYAGISRSTACALALKVQSIGIDKIDKAIQWLIKTQPKACPNPVISHFADELLSANGLLFQKSEELATLRLIKNLESSWEDNL